MAERETEDRRVRKTKKQLRGALTSLLLEKDISRVTVRDVADLADVNRGTFYAHYSDVYDLLHQNIELPTILQSDGSSVSYPWRQPLR